MTSFNPFSDVATLQTQGFNHVFNKIDTGQEKSLQYQSALLSLVDFSVETLFHDKQYSKKYFDTLQKIVQLLNTAFPIPEKKNEAEPTALSKINRLFEVIRGPYFNENAKLTMDADIHDAFDRTDFPEDLFIGLTSAQACYTYLYEKQFVPAREIKSLSRENVRGTLSGLHVFNNIPWAIVGGISATAFKYVEQLR